MVVGSVVVLLFKTLRVAAKGGSPVPFCHWQYCDQTKKAACFYAGGF